MTEPSNDQAPQPESDDAPVVSKVSAELTAEIKAGVAAVTADNKAASGEPAPEPKASKENDGAEVAVEDDGTDDLSGSENDADSDGLEADPDQAGDKQVSEKPAPDPAPKAIPNEVQERAVRAGFSLEEIKQCPNEGFLTAMCDRIESPSGGTGSPSGAGDQGGEAKPATVADMLASIPELDPDIHGDEIVATVEALKGIIQQQAASINEQETRLGELSTAGKKDWLAAKIEGVKDLTKGDADRIASVRDKFDVLKAGYKATGKDITDDLVFDEAASSTLGAESAQVARKTSAVRRRSGQLISRPSGNRVKVKPDAEAEFIAKLDRKHFGR